MGFVLTLILLLYSAICIFLIMVVLLQSGKGGGLSGMLGGGGGSALTDTLGASGAEKTLSNWTTYCAVAFLVLSLAITWFGARQAKTSAMFPDEGEVEVPAETIPESASAGAEIDLNEPLEVTPPLENTFPAE